MACAQRIRSGTAPSATRWQAQVFSEYLAEPDARLMIIGYGFRDEHINAALTQAIDKGLKIFVVDQLGADVAAATNPLPKPAIGYSRRRVSVTSTA
jgi:hypothetical protein